MLEKDIGINKAISSFAGECYILGKDGITFAAKDKSLVENSANSLEMVKTNPALQSVADFQRHAIESKESGIDYYTFKGALPPQPATAKPR